MCWTHRRHRRCAVSRHQSCLRMAVPSTPSDPWRPSSHVSYDHGLVLDSSSWSRRSTDVTVATGYPLFIFHECNQHIVHLLKQPAWKVCCVSNVCSSLEIHLPLFCVVLLRTICFETVNRFTRSWWVGWDLVRKMTKVEQVKLSLDTT